MLRCTTRCRTGVSSEDRKRLGGIEASFERIIPEDMELLEFAKLVRLSSSIESGLSFVPSTIQLLSSAHPPRVYSCLKLPMWFLPTLSPSNSERDNVGQ